MKTLAPYILPLVGITACLTGLKAAVATPLHPNDPSFNSSPFYLIDAPHAWSVTTGDSDVIIGIISTGIDTQHPDIQDNLWTNPGEIADNGLDDDGNGVIDDIHGYNAIDYNGDVMDNSSYLGTQIASIIGAKGNDGFGSAGVNWNVSMIVCKIFDEQNWSNNKAVENCLDYFIDLKLYQGVDIKAINMPFVSQQLDMDLFIKSHQAHDNNIMLLAPAGNGGSSSPLFYPAAYPSVLSVTSVDNNGVQSSFSSYGSIAAPGEGIRVPTKYTDSYQLTSSSGTAFASAFATGAAALVWSKYPDLTATEMTNLLMTNGNYDNNLHSMTESASYINVELTLEDAYHAPRFELVGPSQKLQLIAGTEHTLSYMLKGIADWDQTANLSVANTVNNTLVSLSKTTARQGDVIDMIISPPSNLTSNNVEIMLTADDGHSQAVVPLSIEVFPSHTEHYEYSADLGAETLTIPDYHSISGHNPLTHSIYVDQSAMLYNISLDYHIFHSDVSELTVQLLSPSAHKVKLHLQGGAGQTELNRTMLIDAFRGEEMLGDWTLKISDNANGNTGELLSWKMTLTAQPIYEVIDETPTEIIIQQPLPASLQTKINQEGYYVVTLYWQDATSKEIDIFKNGELLKTTTNDGKGRDKFTTYSEPLSYQICEASAPYNCSMVFDASFDTDTSKEDSTNTSTSEPTVSEEQSTASTAELTMTTSTAADEQASQTLITDQVSR